MKICSKSPETILREALVVARDELHRLNEYGTVRPDPYGVVMDALQKVPALPEISGASDVEQRIVGMLVTDLLAAGLTISVWNGGYEPEIEDSADAAAIFAELAASDQDELTMRRDGKYAGWVRLVWGNDHAVISDYTMGLEDILNGANKLAEELDQ